MDHAQKGTKLLDSKDFAAAIESFNKAISVNPESPDYYIKRSTAYSRLSPPENAKALADADTALAFAKQRGKRELIGRAQLRRGIISFALEKWGDAEQCFEWVKKLTPEDKSLGIWQARAGGKTKDLADDDERKVASIKEYPDVDINGVKEQAKAFRSEAKAKSLEKDTTAKPTLATQTTTAPDPAPVQTPVPAAAPVTKIRHDWYQSTDTITVDIMAKGISEEKVHVDIQANSLSVNFLTVLGSDYDFSLDPLYASIDPSISSFRVMSTKIQITLKKASSGKKWHSLEGDASAIDKTAPSTDETSAAAKKAVLTPSEPSGPVYPTSSKHGAKNWDKLADDLTKKPKKEKSDKDSKDGKDEQDEEAYDSDDGDPVNGFFKKLYGNLDPDSRRAMMKSYQESNGTTLSTNWDEVKKGKVETSPPDGMEAKKWDP
ncbi:MAG: hypothetical protein MMC23_007115 [Stictis urceolatum]|nr:hypothetical protein [Stictis urceolata]